MLVLVTLLACTGTEVAPPPPHEPRVDPEQPVAEVEVVPPPVVIPEGAAVVRSCTSPDASRRSRGSGAGTTTAAPPPAPAASPSSSTRSVVAEGAGDAEAAGGALASGKSASATGGPDQGGGSEGAASFGELARSEPVRGPVSPESTAAATPAPAQPQGQSAAAPSLDGVADMDSSGVSANIERKNKDEKRKLDLSDRTLADEEASEREYRHDPPRPEPEWGGTVYLSNDDSMSLASAQRVLWAAAEGRRVEASQVRPHELLNYFTFDTSPVQRGQLFSVLASAEQTDSDTLSVALAVKGATPPRRPLDLTLVVDVSGSMWAEGRMDYVKRGLTVLSDSLQRGDRVDLVQFDHRVCTPLEDFVVGRDDPRMLTDAIKALTPDGSTNLGKGLEEGYRLATARDEGRNQRVMLLTDAFLNTGDVDENTVSEIGQAFEDHGVRLTGVGVGREFNDSVLDKLTEKGKGAYVYLGSEAVVDRVFGAGFESLVTTIAHDVRFRLDLPNSLAMERFYGEESSSNPEDVQPINYYAGTSQVFLQDLLVRPGGIALGDKLQLTISYRDAASGLEKQQIFKTTLGELVDGDRHNLHKARALIAWSDLLLAGAMGGDACGAPLRAYAGRLDQLSDDVEVGYVNTLVQKQCGAGMDLQALASGGVDYKVKLDSDTPIAEVALQCSGDQQRQRLSGGSKVARFKAMPGSCSLVLQGPVPMVAHVSVPQTGGEVRCLVRGGRLSCS